MARKRLSYEDRKLEDDTLQHALKRFKGEITGSVRVDRWREFEVDLTFPLLEDRYVGALDDAMEILGSASTTQEAHELIANTEGFVWSPVRRGTRQQ